ncbi:ATP-binding cassette domain-containing protein [Streptomyces sp. NPDC086010]|uniref:ATP-binding cassette domain-containing protein n=1 Tax=Streptomyces sp. NPDC086010 TaxID=3365745 RepID=UPI0037D563EF
MTDLVAHHRVHGTRERVLDIGGLSLRAGEFLAVVGRSGSGKTTLARCLAASTATTAAGCGSRALTCPTACENATASRSRPCSTSSRKHGAAFDGHRSVLDQVARTAVRLRGTGRVEAAAEAGRTLAGLGLDEAAVRRAPGGLSGGELQRAALARALLARPRVLICDEITSGLDPVARRSLLDLLAGIARDGDGPGTVLITHDLGTAARAARIVVMDGGKVVEEGPREQILTAPRHPFTAALLEAASTLGAAARS